jgi:hypothetical protein
MKPNQTGPAIMISEENEVFTHNLDVLGLAPRLTVLR